jgi:hypothetical protein
VDDAVAFSAALLARGIEVIGEPDRTRCDFFDRLRDGLRGALRKASVADALAREMALFACVFSFRTLRSQARTDPCPASQVREFTIVNSSGLGSVVAVLLFVSFVELFVVELLLRDKSHSLANALVLVGVYGALWLIGDFRALTLRPFILDNDALWVRVGVRKEARIPLRDIVGIDFVGPSEEPSRTKDGEYIRCTAFGSPQLMLRLRTPTRFDQMIGGPRTASCLGIATDDDAGFISELRARISPIACD